MATVQDCNGWIGNIIRDKRIFFQNVGVDNPLTWLMSWHCIRRYDFFSSDFTFWALVIPLVPPHHICQHQSQLLCCHILHWCYKIVQMIALSLAYWSLNPHVIFFVLLLYPKILWCIRCLHHCCKATSSRGTKMIRWVLNENYLSHLQSFLQNKSGSGMKETILNLTLSPPNI